MIFSKTLENNLHFIYNRKPNMQFLVLNDHDHPFRLLICASVLRMFSCNFRARRFALELDLHKIMCHRLDLSRVESDFLVQNDEQSLLVYLSSLHYLFRRNRKSSSMLRMFDFNFYPQKVGFHDLVNQPSSGFCDVPTYPMNTCSDRPASLALCRVEIVETDLHSPPDYFSQKFNFPQKIEIKNGKGAKQESRIRNALEGALNLHNVADLEFVQEKLTVYISRVQSLRQDPYPAKWFQDTRKLRNIRWICSRYQIEFPTIHSLISESSKLRTLDNLLRKLKQAKHRVLIFCQMTKMMNIIEDYLQFKKYKYYRLDGGSGINERRDMVDGFQSREDVFVFLLSTRAGGLGVTLTAADDVIFYDNDWNPTMDAQAEDRAHRIGRLKDVYIHKLVTKNTIEERILRRAQQKQKVQTTVYSGEVFKANFFSSNEVVNLFFDEEELTQHKMDLKIAREKAKAKPMKKPLKKVEPAPQPNGSIQIENGSK